MSVQDLNDNIPVITSAASFSASENVSDADTLHTITFSDLDTINGITSYEITEDPSSLFEINRSGKISLKPGKSLDYESAQNHSIKITVNDGVNTSAEQTIAISVQAANDEAPVITSDSSFSFFENIGDSEVLHTITFSDLDLINGSTTYEITQSSTAIFEINDNGQISLLPSVSVDYERFQELYVPVSLKVTVNDGVNTSAEQTIAVNVLDVNEDPTAVSFENSLLTLEEDTDLSSRLKLADIAITDDALGTNTISLTGADANKFEVIDEVLYLKAGTVLDADLDNQFSVQINVQDLSLNLSTVVSVEYDLNITETLVGGPAGDSVQLVHQGAADSLSPVIQSLSDGSFVIAWNENNDNIKYSLYDENWVEVAGKTNVTVATATNGLLDNVNSPDITSLMSGGFAIAWADLYTYETTHPTFTFLDITVQEYNVYYSIFDKDGNFSPLDEKISVNGTTFDKSPAITRLNGGDLVFAWQDDNLTQEDIKASLYSGSGTPIPERNDIILSDATGDKDGLSLDATQNGFVATWSNGGDIYTSLFDFDGDVYSTANSRTIADSSSSESTPEILALNNNYVIYTWVSSSVSSSGYFGNLNAAVYYDTGSSLVQIGTDFVINNTAFGNALNSISPLTELAGNNWAVVWESGDDIYGSIHSSNGTVIKDDFLIGDSSLVQSSPSVTAFDDGSFAVTWLAEENGQWNIYRELYDPTGEAISVSSQSGTLANDSLVGTIGYDRFLDLDVGDQAYGFEGNDIFEITSSSFTSINGGIGYNDTLRLGEGVNLVSSDLNKFSDIELIDLASAEGSNSIEITSSFAQGLISSRNTSHENRSGLSYQDGTTEVLRVSGSFNDTVNVETGFSNIANHITVDSISYDLWQHSSDANAEVLIQSGINVTFA